MWNDWSMEEKIIQLAEHLKGRVLQEYNLLGEEQLSTYEHATQAVRERLDPASKVLAGHDFLHTAQQEGESVADFLRWLERVFHIAYGQDEFGDQRSHSLWTTARALWSCSVGCTGLQGVVYNSQK